MEKERFLFFVQNFTSLSEEEADELNSLLKEYPYSQIIHNLATRAAQDNRLKIYNHYLHLSAIYTADRSVLKELMAQPRGAKNELVRPGQVAEPLSENTTDSNELSFVSSTFNNDHLIHEIEFDLARLKELKHNFELSAEEFDKVYHPQEIKKTGKKKAKSSSSPEDEGLIEEIKNSKKAIHIEGEKQKEQLEIINQFIKTSPSISRSGSKESLNSSEDFSENSNAFTDNIISETLVEILLKQGRKEKAIEMLRKLIWKFPQKKAIFAAQIEDLKK